MCELLGLTSKNEIRMNEIFEVFFSHSVEHRNGWGLALFDNSQPFIEKEAFRALDSLLLRSILENEIKTSKCIAHIRRATIGEINVKNAHPFYGCDDYGRQWILAHNGTIFASDVLAAYQYVQEGTTDSERILLYIIDEMNKTFKGGRISLGADDRIRIVEAAIKTIVPGNKVNLMLYDGELFYVHKNESGTLYMKEDTGSVLFSTRPLDSYGWREVPQNTLLVYKDGENVYVGQSHDDTYIHDESKMRLLYFEYSQL